MLDLRELGMAFMLRDMVIDWLQRGSRSEFRGTPLPGDYSDYFL